MGSATEPIRVLYVDDEPDVANTTAAFLEREDSRFRVRTATGTREGMEVLADGAVDCIVSDYDMPGTNGIEFLERVRADHPDLPFILYTGKGSEEVASDAISAGVTDYLQKETGTSQYTLLANRVSNAVDATQSAAEARRRRHRLEQILKTVPGCVVQLDNEGRFVFANRRAEEVLGLERDELTARAYNDPEWAIRDLNGNPIPDEDLPFRQVRDTGDPLYGIRHTIRWPDGTEKTLLVNGAPLFDEDGDVDSVVCSLTDITERKERQHRLEAVKSQYQTLVANFPEGGVFLFDEDCEYVRAGGEEIEAVGLSEADFVGATPHDLFSPEIAEETVEHYREALAGRSDTYEQEYAGNRYRVQTVPVRTDDDVAYGMAVSKNVTEQTEQRRELERQNERLDRFASVVSHDLRNPLNVAKGRLELADEECDSDHIDGAVAALDRSFALIDDVLTLAREGRAVSGTEPVDLTAVTRNCWRHVETAGATLTTAVDRTIRADPTRLRRLLENLVRNSVEHGSTDSRSEPHGNSVEHGSADSRTESGDTVDHTGGGVSITIGELDDGFYLEDDGPGIPPADHETVFEAGHSTAERGTGFGLSIVDEIADAHGWDVRVTEGSAGGARFEITGVTFADK